MATSQEFLQALRLPEVEKRTGLKRSQIYHLESRGAFPRRIKLNPVAPVGASGWMAHEVDAWIAQRVAERDQRVAA